MVSDFQNIAFNVSPDVIFLGFFSVSGEKKFVLAVRQLDYHGTVVAVIAESFRSNYLHQKLRFIKDNRASHYFMNCRAAVLDRV